jgi:hypothetical protein
MGLTIHRDLKGLVIVIAAGFACRHLNLLGIAWTRVTAAAPESERADRQPVPESLRADAIV